MVKKIVIVSSGQPSANPRAVKEAILFSEKKIDVTFIFCPLSPWADAFDQSLFKDHPTIKWISAGYHPQTNKVGYLYARLRKKCWELIRALVGGGGEINIKASVLFSQELEKEALQQRADLYIGHNLGSIEAVYKAAKKYKAKAGFDAEDFHRGEVSENDVRQMQIAVIEDTFFPLMDYCTVASPMIGNAYKELFPAKTFLVINNVFSIKYLKKDQLPRKSNRLELFWFSQFIGPARGLETVVKALHACEDLDIRITLLGNVSESYKEIILNELRDRDKVVFLPAISPDAVFETAAKYDVGLGAEVPITANRDFCLTNKVFTYLLAGNSLILSDSNAQQKFLQEYSDIGLIYASENVEELASVFRKLYNDRLYLEKMKYNAKALACTKMNWEMEGEKLYKHLTKLLTWN